jgi:Asp-tRNA(Asn)/Glu-tRNA(Gln) amidotransferase A subunit family amidase
VIPVSWSLDHLGILTGTVADATLMLNVLGGEDGNDPGTLRLPVTNRLGRSTAKADEGTLVSNFSPATL